MRKPLILSMALLLLSPLLNAVEKKQTQEVSQKRQVAQFPKIITENELPESIKQMKDFNFEQKKAFYSYNDLFRDVLFEDIKDSESLKNTIYMLEQIRKKISDLDKSTIENTYIMSENLQTVYTMWAYIESIQEFISKPLTKITCNENLYLIKFSQNQTDDLQEKIYIYSRSELNNQRRNFILKICKNEFPDQKYN